MTANWSAPDPVSVTPVTASGSVPVLVTVYARAVPGPASTWRFPALNAVAGASVAAGAAVAAAGASRTAAGAMPSS